MLKQENSRLIRRVGHFAIRYKGAAFVCVAAALCTAALEPVLPALMQPLIDKSLIAKNPTALWQIPIFVVIAFSLKGLVEYVSNVASQYLAQSVMSDLRAAVFEQLMALPVARHDAEESGRMLSRVTFDISQMGEFIATGWLTTIRDSLVLVGLVGFLFYLSWPLALVTFAMAPVLAWSIRRAGSRLRHSNRVVQGLVGKLTGFIEEALLGLKEIKIFAAQAGQQKGLQRINQGLREEQMRLVRVQALNVPLVQVMAAASVAIVTYLAGKLSQENLLTPGEFVSFITAMSMVFEPVRRLTNLNAVLQRGLAAAESVFSLLDEPIEQMHGSYAPITAQDRATEKRMSASTSVRVSGKLEFRDVSFSYPDRKVLLRDFNLMVSPRESVALVGPSGVGKTTVFNLLAGFVNPISGAVLIDGQPLEYWGLQIVRQNIALVGQQTVLFDCSIAENVLMGRPNASMEELQEAVRAANLADFVESLPMGLDTPVGPLGSSLSGGQRQRIAIARAFLKDAPILLLDEATSALDKESEAAVLEGLQSLMAGRTVLYISHTPERLLHINRVESMRSNY